MYYNDINENYDSDNESIPEELFEEQVEDENHFDKYLDTVKETYDDLMNYVKYNSQNKKLLQNLNDYMYLEPLFDNKEYQYTETFKRKLKIIEKLKNKDDIYISEPISVSDMMEFDENNNLKYKEKNETNFVLVKPKILKERVEKTKKRKERLRLRREKREKEEMMKRTNNILNRYRQ